MEYDVHELVVAVSQAFEGGVEPTLEVLSRVLEENLIPTLVTKLKEAVSKFEQLKDLSVEKAQLRFDARLIVTALTMIFDLIVVLLTASIPETQDVGVQLRKLQSGDMFSAFSTVLTDLLQISAEFIGFEVRSALIALTPLLLVAGPREEANLEPHYAPLLKELVISDQVVAPLLWLTLYGHVMVCDSQPKSEQFEAAFKLASEEVRNYCGDRPALIGRVYGTLLVFAVETMDVHAFVLGLRQTHPGAFSFFLQLLAGALRLCPPVANEFLAVDSGLSEFWNACGALPTPETYPHFLGLLAALSQTTEGRDAVVAYLTTDLHNEFVTLNHFSTSLQTLATSLRSVENRIAGQDIPCLDGICILLERLYDTSCLENALSQGLRQILTSLVALVGSTLPLPSKVFVVRAITAICQHLPLIDPILSSSPLFILNPTWGVPETKDGGIYYLAHRTPLIGGEHLLLTAIFELYSQIVQNCHSLDQLSQLSPVVKTAQKLILNWQSFPYGSEFKRDLYANVSLFLLSIMKRYQPRPLPTQQVSATVGSTGRVTEKRDTDDSSVDHQVDVFELTFIPFLEESNFLSQFLALLADAVKHYDEDHHRYLRHGEPIISAALERQLFLSFRCLEVVLLKQTALLSALPHAPVRNVAKKLSSSSQFVRNLVLMVCVRADLVHQEHESFISWIRPLPKTKLLLNFQEWCCVSTVASRTLFCLLDQAPEANSCYMSLKVWRKLPSILPRLQEKLAGEIFVPLMPGVSVTGDPEYSHPSEAIFATVFQRVKQLEKVGGVVSARSTLIVEGSHIINYLGIHGALCHPAVCFSAGNVILHTLYRFFNRENPATSTSKLVLLLLGFDLFFDTHGTLPVMAMNSHWQSQEKETFAYYNSVFESPHTVVLRLLFGAVQHVSSAAEVTLPMFLCYRLLHHIMSVPALFSLIIPHVHIHMPEFIPHVIDVAASLVQSSSGDLSEQFENWNVPRFTQSFDDPVFAVAGVGELLHLISVYVYNHASGIAGHDAEPAFQTTELILSFDDLMPNLVSACLTRLYPIEAIQIPRLLAHRISLETHLMPPAPSGVFDDAYISMISLSLLTTDLLRFPQTLGLAMQDALSRLGGLGDRGSLRSDLQSSLTSELHAFFETLSGFNLLKLQLHALATLSEGVTLLSTVLVTETLSQTTNALNGEPELLEFFETVSSFLALVLSQLLAVDVASDANSQVRVFAPLAKCVLEGVSFLAESNVLDIVSSMMQSTLSQLTIMTIECILRHRAPMVRSPLYATLAHLLKVFVDNDIPIGDGFSPIEPDVCKSLLESIFADAQSHMADTVPPVLFIHCFHLLNMWFSNPILLPFDTSIEILWSQGNVDCTPILEVPIEIASTSVPGEESFLSDESALLISAKLECLKSMANSPVVADDLAHSPLMVWLPTLASELDFNYDSAARDDVGISTMVLVAILELAEVVSHTALDKTAALHNLAEILTSCQHFIMGALSIRPSAFVDTPAPSAVPSVSSMENISVIVRCISILISNSIEIPKVVHHVKHAVRLLDFFGTTPGSFSFESFLSGELGGVWMQITEESMPHSDPVESRTEVAESYLSACVKLLENLVALLFAQRDTELDGLKAPLLFSPFASRMHTPLEKPSHAPALQDVYGVAATCFDAVTAIVTKFTGLSEKSTDRLQESYFFVCECLLSLVAEETDECCKYPAKLLDGEQHNQQPSQVLHSYRTDLQRPFEMLKRSVDSCFVENPGLDGSFVQALIMNLETALQHP